MRVGIALGSNLGDRLANLHAAAARLATWSSAPIRCSRIYATPPVDCPPGSPDFLNAVVEIDSEIPPRDLLARLQAIENDMGRPGNHGHHEPRSIDLDILYCGNLEIADTDLVIPHPRITEREFVLRPLADIAGDRVVEGRTVRAWLDTLPASTARPAADFVSIS